jgi:hypothetical protein
MLVLVGIGMREEEGERGDGTSLGGGGTAVGGICIYLMFISA